MYEAWEAESAKEGIRLAKEALSISLDCADAYNLLAEEEAETLEEVKDLYQKGIDAGRRALGEKIFKKGEYRFWLYTPTRPYMRARAGLMECLWELGDYDEAIVVENVKAVHRTNKKTVLKTIKPFRDKDTCRRAKSC